MKVNEILVESRMKDIQHIVDKAEARAFEDSEESKSAVHGDTVLKYAMEELGHMGLNREQHNAAAEMIKHAVEHEYGK